MCAVLTCSIIRCPRPELGARSQPRRTPSLLLGRPARIRRSTPLCANGKEDRDAREPEKASRRPQFTAAPVDDLVGHVSGNATGPHLFADPQRLFADPDPGPDETSFHEPNLEERYYTTGYYFCHQKEIQPFPPPAPNPPRIDFAQILGPNLLGPILAAGAITFHAVGDTGASGTSLIDPEARVVDAMAADLKAGKNVPAFGFTSAMSSTTSVRASTTTTSSTSPSGPMTDRSSPSPATTTAPSMAPTSTSRSLRPSRRSCATSAPTRPAPRRMRRESPARR